MATECRAINYAVAGSKRAPVWVAAYPLYDWLLRAMRSRLTLVGHGLFPTQSSERTILSWLFIGSRPFAIYPHSPHGT